MLGINSGVNTLRFHLPRRLNSIYPTVPDRIWLGEDQVQKKMNLKKEMEISVVWKKSKDLPDWPDEIGLNLLKVLKDDSRGDTFGCSAPSSWLC